MKVTHEELLYRAVERTAANTQDIRQKNRQRRNQVTDIYGVEYTRQCMEYTPATFYIPISPASAYLERFSFKLIIEPFETSIGKITNTKVNVNDTSLSVNGTNISPNPHSHTTDNHSHGFTAGINQVLYEEYDFQISVEGIDITPYLMAQYGEWPDNIGVYPSLSIDEDYDILEVASDFEAEGRTGDAAKLVRSGYKPVTFYSNNPVKVTMVVWVRFSHVNR